MMEFAVVGLWAFIAIASVGDALWSLWKAWRTRTSTVQFQCAVIAWLGTAIIMAWLFI